MDDVKFEFIDIKPLYTINDPEQRRVFDRADKFFGSKRVNIFLKICGV